MRYLSAGESHGPQLTAIIEGVPAGLCLRSVTGCHGDCFFYQNVCAIVLFRHGLLLLYGFNA